MLNIETLKVGDDFYQVREKNLAFNRKKIHREIDGQDWFRYDKPLREYSISTYTVLGILKPIVEGEWPEDESCALETEFYVRAHDSGSSFTTTLEYEIYFSNYEDAVSLMTKLQKEASKLDMP